MYYPLSFSLSLSLDVAAALRLVATPHAAGLSRLERSPITKHRELPTISVSKSGSSSSKSETAHLSPKSDTHLSPHKSSPTHEVTAKEKCSAALVTHLRMWLFIIYQEQRFVILNLIVNDVQMTCKARPHLTQFGGVA